MSLSLVPSFCLKKELDLQAVAFLSRLLLHRDAVCQVYYRVNFFGMPVTGFASEEGQGGESLVP
jgi:hypothetical protein